MKACDACGSKMKSQDIYCSFCGTYYMKESMSSSTLQNLIDLVIKQISWLESFKMNDAIDIPTGKFEDSNVVKELRNLQLDNLADHLVTLFSMGPGVHQGVNTDTVIDCKQLENGYISVVELKLGDETVKIPVYTDNEKLTIAFATLIKVVVTASTGGLLKSTFRPIPLEDL